MVKDSRISFQRMPRFPVDFDLLPGVSRDYVLDRLAKAGGHELDAKLASQQSSAALAVNTFGWFHNQPKRLPQFQVLLQVDWQPIFVQIEYCARFPWRGGRHPWLDAWVETAEAIIGIESKRFEPFRDSKTCSLSDAYDRKVWHDQMVPFEILKDRLRSRNENFEFLDATQLVKHAFGLITEGRRKEKRPFLVYLFAEPAELDGTPIPDCQRQHHREEIARFSAAVSGAEVIFAAMSYREWLDSWPSSDSELLAHRGQILAKFQP